MSTATTARHDALEASWATVLRRIRVDDSGCWLWTGSKTSKGYGEVVVAGTGQKILVHRLALLMRDGGIPAGHVADHTCHDPRTCEGGSACRHRLCVNPQHLDPVTIAENSRRGAQQNRATCKRGHLLGFRIRRGKAIRCCRRCESIDREARRSAGAAAVDVICGVAMVAFLAGFPIAMFMIGTSK